MNFGKKNMSSQTLLNDVTVMSNYFNQIRFNLNSFNDTNITEMNLRTYGKNCLSNHVLGTNVRSASPTTRSENCSDAVPLIPNRINVTITRKS